jgi:hypothetical protein
MPRGAIAIPGRASSPLLALPTIYASRGEIAVSPFTRF